MKAARSEAKRAGSSQYSVSSMRDKDVQNGKELRHSRKGWVFAYQEYPAFCCPSHMMDVRKT